MRSQEALDSFVAYCNANPEQRFWQALRNWSRFDFILGFNGDIFDLMDAYSGFPVTDTFHIEGLGATDPNIINQQ